MRVDYKWLLVSLAAIVLIGATTVTYKQNKVKEVNLNNQIEQLKEQSKARSEADKQKLQKRELELQQQVRELNEKLQSKAAEKARIAAETAQKAARSSVTQRVVQTVVPTAQAATGSHNEWMAAAGISPADYQYVEYIVQKESGWRYTAVNAGSGATGLCQSLPASKMATAGGDYLTNPVTQLRWCNSYAQARYGGWAGAYQFWISRHWW